jgi:hypothetical protein
MEHQITAMAMDGCQNGMGENEIKPSLIKIGGRLKVNGVAAFNKKAADMGTGINEAMTGQLRAASNLRIET